MKLIATVFENSLVLFLLEICDTGRCRESVLEYLVVYLKDDDSKFAKKGRNKSCSNWYLFCTACQIKVVLAIILWPMGALTATISSRIGIFPYNISRESNSGLIASSPWWHLNCCRKIEMPTLLLSVFFGYVEDCTFQSY